MRRPRFLAPTLGLIVALLSIGVMLDATSAPRPSFTSPSAEMVIGPIGPGGLMPGTLSQARAATSGYRTTRVQLAMLGAALVTASFVTGGALGYANRPRPTQTINIVAPASAIPAIVDSTIEFPVDSPMVMAVAMPRAIAPPRVAPVATTAPPVPRPARVVRAPISHFAVSATTVSATTTTVPPSPSPRVASPPTLAVTTTGVLPVTSEPATPDPDPSSASPYTATVADTTKASDGSDRAPAP